jgi:hypothetical protein
VENGKKNLNWIINNVLAFLAEYKDRYDRREISGSTIRKSVKVVKLLCEMNDIGTISWKKITHGPPRGGNGLMIGLQALRKYESYANIPSAGVQET